MTKIILAFVAVLAMAWPSSATTTRKSSTRRVHAASVAPSTKKGASHKASKYTAQKGRRGRRSSQQTPTPERYKEIQQALASKGQFHGEPNGQWGAESEDALKRFQAEQNLTPTGKLNSMSLIALGLGPKRLAATSPKPDVPKPDIPQ